MKPRRGGQFSLLDMDREELLALGRQGLRFRDIGEALNIAGSTAHVYWKRWAGEDDRRARIVAIATRESLHLDRPADDEILPRQIGPDFTDCAFLDDPRAANGLDRLGRLNRPEPFGFSLYGGTFR
jgi:hypothetical protein